MKWQNARLVRRQERSRKVTSFFLEPETPFSFKAGQHVDIRLTAPDGYTAQRSYSIASGPEEGGPLELAIEKLDDGEVSPFFHEVAEVGDMIELRGPIGGHFVWSAEDGGPLLLLAGGSGLVPLLSMLRHRFARGDKTPTALVLSIRGEADFLFGDELEAFAARDPRFRLLVTMTRATTVEGAGRKGRIATELLREAVSGWASPPLHTLICGSNAFVNAASDAALEAGVPVSGIRTERYGG